MEKVGIASPTIEQHWFLIVVILKLAGDHWRLICCVRSAIILHDHLVVLHVRAQVCLHCRGPAVLQTWLGETATMAGSRELTGGIGRHRTLFIVFLREELLLTRCILFRCGVSSVL